MKNKNVLIVLLVGMFCSQLVAQTTLNYDQLLLNRIRQTATYVIGEYPLSVNYIKFAESPRTWEATIEGGDTGSYIQARTAFQIKYEEGFIIVDSGMDEEVHSFFGKNKKEPFFHTKKDTIDQALNQANLILITHEHADHVAGVIRNKNRKKIANKTMITKTMIDVLINKPQTPLIQLTEKESKDYLIVDFPEILPVAPGVVLIQAPGHTRGEIMIYAKMKDGKEYIFTGDVSWSYKGILEQKLKPEFQIKRIGENPVLITQQINWLNMLLKEPSVVLIVSHDDILLKDLEKKQIIKEGFSLLQ